MLPSYCISDNAIHERRWRILGLSNLFNTRFVFANENKVRILVLTLF
jgi:hypothetical protein